MQPLNQNSKQWNWWGREIPASPFLGVAVVRSVRARWACAHFPKFWGKPARLGALSFLGLKGLEEGNLAFLIRCAQLHRGAAFKWQNWQRTNRIQAVLWGFYRVGQHRHLLSAWPIGRVQVQKRSAAFGNNRSLSTSPASLISLCISCALSSISSESSCTHL